MQRIIANPSAFSIHTHTSICSTSNVPIVLKYSSYKYGHHFQFFKYVSIFFSSLFFFVCFMFVKIADTIESNIQALTAFCAQYLCMHIRMPNRNSVYSIWLCFRKSCIRFGKREFIIELTFLHESHCICIFQLIIVNRVRLVPLRISIQ